MDIKRRGHYVTRVCKFVTTLYIYIINVYMYEDTYTCRSLGLKNFKEWGVGLHYTNIFYLAKI